MSKSVNVRVPKAKLLKALKDALAVKVKEKADYDKTEKAREQQIADIKKSIVTLVKSGKLTVKEVTFPYSYRNESTKTVEVTFNHKFTLPERDTDFHEHTNTHSQEELGNAIRVLELSDEEYVRTSSYGAVARYL